MFSIAQPPCLGLGVIVDTEVHLVKRPRGPGEGVTGCIVYVPFSCYTSHISVHKEVKIVHMVRSLPFPRKGAALVRRQIC